MAARTAAWAKDENPLFVFPRSWKKPQKEDRPGNIVYDLQVGEAIVSAASNGYFYQRSNETMSLEDMRIGFYSTTGMIADYHCVVIPQILEKNRNYRFSCSASSSPQRIFISGYIFSEGGYVNSAQIDISASTVKNFNSGNFDLLLFGFSKSTVGDGSIVYSDILLEKL